MNALVPAFPDGINIHWVVRRKDCSEPLLRELKIDDAVVIDSGRGVVTNAIEFAGAVMRTIRETRRRNIDLWFSKYGAVNMAARLLGVRNVSFNDDDADIVPIIAKTSYPFADRVLCLTETRMKGYEEQAIRYDSFHELYYLHPNRFSPDQAVLERNQIDCRDPYCIIRLSALTAHHDVGVGGVAEDLLDEILAILSGKLRVYISSEKPLAEKYRPYGLSAGAADIHHLLAFAELLIGDSQTMSAEAAVLGTPAIRISDFTGKLSYLNTLESYGLITSFTPSNTGAILSLVRSLEFGARAKAEHRARREVMLKDKIDPVPWVVQQLLSLL